MAVIESLLDNDLYKFTMMQTVLHNFPKAQAEYKFVLRSKGIDLLPYKQEIEEEIENLCYLFFEPKELDFMSSQRFLSSDYIDFLENFSLNRKNIKVFEEEGQLAISIKGSWVQTILFEVPVMAIVSEVYCRNQIDADDAHWEGYRRLQEKLLLLNNVDLGLINLADFGTRRRFSREWHYKVLKAILDSQYGKILKGTSNLWLAYRLGLIPIGTMAHEFLQAGQGLGEVQLINSQKYMLEKWVQEYRGDLGIALTDTIGMDAFLKDFDLYFSKLFDGCRHDSGDPKEWCEKLINHYVKMRIDPKTKTAVFSDGLNFQKMIELAVLYQNRIKTSFGIGTNLTNDVGIKALSMVIKLVRINGNPVAKISDEPQKIICLDPEFLSYLMKVFGVSHV